MSQYTETIPGPVIAERVKYDNTTSGLQSVKVQGAIDELANQLIAGLFVIDGGNSLVSNAVTVIDGGDST